MSKPSRFHPPASWARAFTSLASHMGQRLTFGLKLLTLAYVCCVHTTPSAAQPPAVVPPTERELFVPFEDLNILLGGDTRRVFMTRAEYADLLNKAKRAPEERLPQETAILSAEYEAVLEVARASLAGRLHIEVFGEGLHTVPLALSGVGIRSATLDDQPAALIEEAGGAVLLVVEGRGDHILQLDMVLPLSAAAAEQSLSWQVPVPPATTFRVTVPGNVEVKSGASIISRRVDSDAGVTHFELLPTAGQMNLVMSLNNRRLRDETTVLARGVLVDELTQGYERLHASFSMNILHGASDEFRIAVPEGFEVTQVATPLLARWSIEEGDDEHPRVLEIKLRELTTERVLINVRADRTTPVLADWQMPKLIPLDVAGFASVVGILLEEQLTSGPIATYGLIPIDNRVLTAALPESVLAAEPGMPRVRPLVTYYAAREDFSLETGFKRQPAQLYVTTNLLLTLTDRGLEVDGGFALLPEREKLFSFEFHVPQGWSVDQVRTADGTALAFERYPDDDGTRIRVPLPAGLAPRATMNVLFHATHSPTDWLSEWTEQTIELPQIGIVSNEEVHESGAIAVRALDDLQVRPTSTSGLIVLTDSEKNQYGFSGEVTNLAWRTTEDPWEGELSVTPTVPRITGRALSFFQISPEALTSHFEMIYLVEQARTQRVSFSLPESTPIAISIRGLDDTSVKETSSELIDGRRHWDVQLAEKKTGRIRLAVDFVQPLTEASLKAYVLPQIRAEDVAYQSGLIAVEGHPEIDVSVVQHPRAVDMGELVDAEYQVGKRLLGVFSYVGSDGQTSVDVVRRTIHALPTTIVQQAGLVTLVGTNGVGQTAARFALRTKALYIEVRLPAEATLWSAQVDGQPALPERQGDHTVIALPAAPADQSRDLQIVYEQPIDSLMLRGQIDLPAPTLWQRMERDGSNEPVPLADLHWELVLPVGYRLADVRGTLTPTNPDRRWPLQYWLDWFVELGGGYGADGRRPTAAMMSWGRGVRAGTEQAAQIDSVPLASSLDASESMRDEASSAADAAMGSVTRSPAPENMQKMSRGPLNRMRPAQPASQPAAPGMPLGANQPASDPFLAAGQTQGRRQPQDGGQPQQVAQQAIQGKSAWTLAGMRSLAIPFSTANLGQSVTFNSLGVDPVLRATLVDQRRWQWLGLACGLTVFVIGLWRTGNRFSARLRYVGYAVFLALLLPPLTGWRIELEPVVQAILAAAVALVAISIVSALAKASAAQVVRIKQRRAARTSKAATTTLVLLAWACLGYPELLRAQESAARPATGPVTVTNLSELEALFESLPSPGQVAIPADAIVVPYDPAAPDAVTRAEKLLVPYDQYVRLWNAAHPDRMLAPQPPVTAYAQSDAQYRAVLGGDNDLKLSGSVVIHVYAEGEVSVPLSIGGGVLESATVDGQPARLQVVEPRAAAQKARGAASEQAATQQRAMAAGQNPAETLLLLHLEGKGRKELVIEARLKIEKRGGWRVVDGRLPASPATGLQLTVPQAKTEIRFQGFADRGSVETQEADETIETALPASGRVQLQWRAKIAEATVDQGLSVNAQAVFDVQEDGLKFAWHGQFDFRRGRRESFTLRVPSSYIIEKVVGSNVRGWDTELDGDEQQLTVDLLTAVSERETLTIFMMRAYTAEPDESATITVPVVQVPDAMLQQGQLAVRRSSLLELRTDQVRGLSRIDTPDDRGWLTEPVDSSPLPLKPYQAFRFSQVPYTLTLSAEPSERRLRATAQTLLKLSQLQSTLESRLILQVTQRAMHHVRISVPANWKLEPPQVAVGYEWNVQPGEAGQQWLEIYFASGMIGEVPIVLRGKLEQSLAADADDVIPAIPLPRITIEDAFEQAGDIVITSDPAFDVRAEQLQNCDTALLGSADNWLAPDQRALARLLIHYAGSDYSGQLRVTRRAPQVSAFSVTNVKVTDRSIEETIYLELTIRSAGIRQVSIVVPASMAKARVRGRLIRQETWTQVGSEGQSPWRLVVELQEDVMGQYSLILEHDRLPASGEQAVPIPVIETGTTDHRFVTLENSGRDELVVAERSALEPLERSQAQWRLLNTLLGGKATEAFVVRENAEAPRLTFRTRERAAVETVGARIGIARTLMVVDENGGYRAVQEFRVENRTEQYLEIALPEGARLWTVMVAGEPVKPMASLAASSADGQNADDSSTHDANLQGQRLRIPLVKTAIGDLDYGVTIKYGGHMRQPGAMHTTNFPLVETVNIRVELSQVRLRLPENRRWFNFGGSMGRVLKPGELEAGWLSFRTRQLNELTELLSRTDDNDFSKARATNNLKQLGKEIEDYRRRSDVAQPQSEELKEQLAYNSAAWADAQQQLQTPENQFGDVGAHLSNRQLLNQRFEQQGNQRSYNVASEKGDNFQQVEPPLDKQQAATAGTEFDAEWLAGNSLQSKSFFEEAQQPAGEKGERALDRVVQQSAEGRQDGQAPAQAAGKPAPSKLATPNAAAKFGAAAVPPIEEDRSGQVYRYQRRLEQQAPQQLGALSQSSTEPSGYDAPGGMGMGIGGGASGGSMSGGFAVLGDFADPMSGAAVPNQLVPPAPGYLASLDVELPVRGVEYLFTTPRGETEITAQSISEETLSRWSMIAIIIVAALVIALLARIAAHARSNRALRIATSTALIVLGLALLLTGTTPLYAMLTLGASIALLMRR